MAKASLHDTQLEPAVEQLSDKYEIHEQLGGGGMGRVFRALHRQLKRPVAIKLLMQHLGGDEAVARFLREARTAAQIGSPHVAHIMDAGVLPSGQPYIVMEYLRGRDLGRWLRERGRLPVEEAADFVLQALEALAEAHALQIVHRDIKPDNLFATHMAGGEVLIKVLDFGLAKAGPSLESSAPVLTERGAVLGTPSYMAPEQFVDAQQADVRSDLWAVGATLFELVTGAPPFSGTSLPQVYHAVMHRSIPTIRSLVPELPEWLSDVVATCLTRERELRYADAAELASALMPWVGPTSQARIERIRRIVHHGSCAGTIAIGALDVASLEPAEAKPSASTRGASSAGWIGLALAAAGGAALLWQVAAQASREDSPAPKPPSRPALVSTVANAAPSPSPSPPPVAGVPSPDPVITAPAPSAPRRPARTHARKPAVAPAHRDPSSAYEQYP